MVCAFSPTGKTLLSGSWDNHICVWDFRGANDWRQSSPACLAELRDHQNTVWDIAFNPSNCGEQFASASADGTVRIWDSPEFEEEEEEGSRFK